jgi:hypothetical protein
LAAISALKDKIATLKQEMLRLKRLEVRRLAAPDQQISLTDPDARSMATSGRGSGIVGYNLQSAVDTRHHLIVAHDVSNPEAMRQRRETVEYPFGTIKAWMGSTHFQMRTLKRVSTEMALHVLAYNFKRVMNILGIAPLIAALSAA